jgi:hypothetical protein
MSSAKPSITAYLLRLFGRGYDRTSVGLKHRDGPFVLPAPANLHAQIAAGAPLNITDGWLPMPVPSRAPRISMGPGTVPCVLTLTGKRFGVTKQIVFNVTGEGDYDADIVLDENTSLVSNIDPGGTVDVKTGLGWGLPNPANDAEQYAIDGVAGTPNLDWLTGSVRISPASPPDGVKAYVITYTPRFE